jgi:hypothetical protein
MVFDQKIIAKEQIWKYLPAEHKIDQQLKQAVGDRSDVAYGIVDSLFLHNPGAWTDYSYVVTDNIPLKNISGEFLPLFPEAWHVYLYNPMYQDRLPRYAFNCFMNRICPERARVFEYIQSQGLLEKGLVSFNNLRPGNIRPLEQDIQDYGAPFNNIVDSLEQSIIDCNLTVILETYISDSHVTYSEKIFRSLQLPRPWLLFCSPQAVHFLRSHGFDVLDDYVDHGYDLVPNHTQRLEQILQQIHRFVNRSYSDQDRVRFAEAVIHNNNLLKQLSMTWPDKLNTILNVIQPHVQNTRY